MKIKPSKTQSHLRERSERNETSNSRNKYSKDFIKAFKLKPSAPYLRLRSDRRMKLVSLLSLVFLALLTGINIHSSEGFHFKIDYSCVENGQEYLPGATFMRGVCEKCECKLGVTVCRNLSSASLSCVRAFLLSSCCVALGEKMADNLVIPSFCYLMTSSPGGPINSSLISLITGGAECGRIPRQAQS
ncbi:hypothetical protein RRG08_045789 [Elysia crispata]|uniref:Uncharacterized protein n=1 Tax=Elysia crispata TaxID=231223 RepID=A0AAE1E8H8_9GAST|nr:hypothetical protein RRG08_045789 [Elysia crispata]